MRVRGQAVVAQIEVIRDDRNLDQTLHVASTLYACGEFVLGEGLGLGGLWACCFSPASAAAKNSLAAACLHRGRLLLAGRLGALVDCRLGQ